MVLKTAVVKPLTNAGLLSCLCVYSCVLVCLRFSLVISLANYFIAAAYQTYPPTNIKADAKLTRHLTSCAIYVAQVTLTQRVCLQQTYHFQAPNFKA